MRKFIALLGGISLMASVGSAAIACNDNGDVTNNFALKNEYGEVVDSFNKKEVVDYYFPWYDSLGDSTPMTEIVINFKTETKNYGQKSGSIEVFLKQLIEGLRMKPDQKGYNAPSIPPGVWRNIGWWDYTNNRPKDL